jgi:hypothetical protein
MRCGTTVRLEVRNPVIGERWQRVRVTNSDWVSAGKPTDKWIEWIKASRFLDCSLQESARIDAERVYIVLVPVEQVPV